jgi:hypothetical protein
MKNLYDKPDINNYIYYILTNTITKMEAITQSPCIVLPDFYRSHALIKTGETQFPVLLETVDRILAEELQRFQRERPGDEMHVKYLSDIQSWSVSVVALTGLVEIRVNAFLDNQQQHHILHVQRISSGENYLDSTQFDIYNAVNKQFNPSAANKKRKFRIPQPFSDGVISFILPEEKQLILLERLRRIQFVAKNVEQYDTRAFVIEELCLLLNQAKTDEELLNTMAFDNFQEILNDIIHALMQELSLIHI